MVAGTAFHPRTAPLNRKAQWREWSGFLAALVYHDRHDIEYNAIRSAVALIDVSPLYKYRVAGRDAQRLVDRVITRDAARLGVGGVVYTSWCDESGHVVDDGTVARIDETTFRWTAAEPSLRWLWMNASGLDVEVEDLTESVAALAVQGPLSRAVLEGAAEESLADLRYFRRRAATLRGIEVDVSRTGYTGDLGYELWVSASRAVELWDALWEVGEAYGMRPAGLNALDVARVEAGLLLLDVDYTSSRRAVIADQAYSPFELGILGRFVDLDKGPFVGRRALRQQQRRGGPRRRLVGLEADWNGIEAVHEAHGLPSVMSPLTSRAAVPVFSAGRAVGRATSTAWSPVLKKAVGLASVTAEHAASGTELRVEWTVEARRHTVPARVVDLPFFDPPRKRA